MQQQSLKCPSRNTTNLPNSTPNSPYKTRNIRIRIRSIGLPSPEFPGLVFPGVFQVRSFRAYTRSFRADLTKGQKHHACHGVQWRMQHSQCAGKEKGAERGREGREGCGEAYPVLDSCGGRPNDGARRVRRSFRRPTMEDVRGKPFRPRNGSNGLGERWRTRKGRCSWKKSTIRRSKVEIDGGMVGE